MIVELKSLLPSPEEELRENVSLFREALPSRVPLVPDTSQTLRLAKAEETPGEPPPSPETLSSENALTHLLEQLIQYSEQNAASTEKIADILESRESTNFPVYN